jgi:hypothetical protein
MDIKNVESVIIDVNECKFMQVKWRKNNEKKNVNGSNGNNNGVLNSMLR